MIPDRDIWLTANVMVNRFGAEAPVHAAMRYDEHLEAGDLDGAAVWRAVLQAIDALLADKPTGLVH